MPQVECSGVMEGPPWQFDPPASGKPVLGYATPASPTSRSVRRLLVAVLISVVMACLVYVGALGAAIGAYRSIEGATEFSATVREMSSPYPIHVAQPLRFGVTAMLFSTALMIVLLAGYAFRVTRVFDHSATASALRRSAWVLFAGTILYLLISTAFLGDLYRVLGRLPISWPRMSWPWYELKSALVVNVLAIAFTAGAICLGMLTARRMEKS